LELVTLKKPGQAVPTLQKDVAAGNTSVVDENQKRLTNSAGGNSLPDVPFPDVPFPEVRPDGSVGKQLSSSSVAAEAMGVAFGLGLCSFLVGLFV
jgi:hypothetical protein